MKETPQEYTKRILGYVAGKDGLRMQATTAAKLARLIRDLSPRQLRRRPAPERWSIAEILAHLAEVGDGHGLAPATGPDEERRPGARL
jgi:DinB superfamily